MKSRANVIHYSASFQPGQRSKSMDWVRFRQQRRLLLGVSILLILCWTIGAIWLISVRRAERNMAEVSVQQRVIAASFSAKTARSH